jgi:hypothetical protein
MKHSLTTGLAATVFAIGLASAAQAHTAIDREDPGMECNEGNAGMVADDGYNVYYCDGRNWIRTGSI